MREMVIASLRGEPDLRFAQASSGLEAIEQLSLGAFALVVLDLNMPDIGGIEVLEFVRGQEPLAALPILVLTTRGEESSRQKVMAAGASAYMTKPFTPEGLVAQVRELLGVRAAADAPA
jgi:two-component system chemotaxis response regulator CheY